MGATHLGLSAVVSLNLDQIAELRADPGKAMLAILDAIEERKTGPLLGGAVHLTRRHPSRDIQLFVRSGNEIFPYSTELMKRDSRLCQTVQNVILRPPSEKKEAREAAPV